MTTISPNYANVNFRATEQVQPKKEEVKKQQPKEEVKKDTTKKEQNDNMVTSKKQKLYMINKVVVQRE